MEGTGAEGDCLTFLMFAEFCDRALVASSLALFQEQQVSRHKWGRMCPNMPWEEALAAGRASGRGRLPRTSE